MALTFKDGKVNVMDIGILDEVMFKLPKESSVPLSQGMVLNFASAVVYGVQGIGEKLQCKFIKTMKASTGKQVDFTGEDFEAKIEGELIISKIKKKGRAKVGHSMISGEHAKVTTDSITDTSTNGTYILAKKLDEIVAGISSKWVPIEANSEVWLSDYMFNIS